MARQHGHARALAFLQALGGSVVPTAVQAMVRDMYDRNQSARILSLNMVVTASAPVVAPLIGGQLLLWLDWRAFSGCCRRSA